VSRIRPRLTYANVMATIAVFIALGGTTIAANKINGQQIKKGTIRGKQIKKSSVPGNRLKADSVTGKQLREATLGRVPAAVLADRAKLADTAARADSAEFAESATAAGTAEEAATLEGFGAADLLDACPDGTQPYAGSCFESGNRPATTWPTAAETCGDEGRRLPALGELEGFRQEPGIVLGIGAQPEHTSEYLDANGVNSGGELTVALYENGAITVGLGYGSNSASYRCVAPLTNSGQ
jgi:hypothetical protein